MFITGCGKARTPVSLLDDEIQKLEASLNGLRGHNRAEVIKVLGQPNYEQYMDTAKETVMSYRFSEANAQLILNEELILKNYLIKLD